MSDKSLNTNNQAKVNGTRWKAYVAAGAASVFATQAAEAEIIHVNVNQVLNVGGGPGTTFGSLGFNVGGTSSIVFGHLANTSVGAAFFGANGANAQFGGFQAFGYQYVFNLASGQNISTINFLSGTGTMAFVSGFGNSEFLAPGIGFMGFSFDAGGGTQFGWARVDMSGAPQNFFEVIDYAYGMAGEQIAAGQTRSTPVPVPEPGSLGLLAVGGAGLLMMRNRRKKSEAS